METNEWDELVLSIIMLVHGIMPEVEDHMELVLILWLSYLFFTSERDTIQ
jgi:hypothetical protein